MEDDAGHKERRQHERFRPTNDIPCLFGAVSVKTPAAGFIVDLSEGGLKIVAPPTSRPHLYWGDTVSIQASYSPENRRDGIEGLTFTGIVVATVSNQKACVVHARFDRATTGRQLLQRYIKRFESKQ